MTGKTPYRKPSPTPPPERNVVTRAESPEERDAREARELAAIRQKSHKAQTALVHAELEGARAQFTQKMRLVGGALVLLSLFSLYLDVQSIAEGASSIWVSRLGPFTYFVGPFLLIAGGGGAASPDSVPNWWRAGVIGSFLLGLGLGSSFEVEIAEMVARLFYG